MNLSRKNLLLFHELGIRAIINDVFPKAGSRQHRVNFLSVDIFEFPIQDELIPLWSKVDCNFPAQQNERENIAILCNGLISIVDINKELFDFLTFA